MKWIFYTDFRFLVFLILLIVQKCRLFWKGRGDILEDYVYCDNFTEIINLNQSVLSIETAFYLFAGSRKLDLVVWLFELWGNPLQT